jgi:Lrp/AsnC family leucine-responsive transcriptional regulator
MTDLDHFDLALLDVLQRFGRATHQQLGEEVPLSPSQIGRRLQRLEATGVIDGYRVVLRPEKLGLGVTAFTSLKLNRLRKYLTPKSPKRSAQTLLVKTPQL